jgi:hypothetical protein
MALKYGCARPRRIRVLSELLFLPRGVHFTENTLFTVNTPSVDAHRRRPVG